MRIRAPGRGIECKIAPSSLRPAGGLGVCGQQVGLIKQTAPRTRFGTVQDNSTRALGPHFAASGSGWCVTLAAD